MAGRFSVEAVFSAIDRISAPVSRMQQRIGRFARAVESNLRSLNRGADALAGGIGSVGTAVAGLSVAGAGLVAITAGLTEADVRAQQLATSVGMNVSEVEAVTKALAGAGFEFDNVIDLAEEMNNKLGESAGLEELGPVTESLEILGLSFQKIRQLSPEEQFKAITDAALQMEDAQQAAAAADILLGGEANKIIGVLRQQGTSLDDITKKYKELSFRSDESRAGAVAFQEQIKAVTGAVSSITSEIAGLAGGAMAPMVEQLTDWLRANRDLVKSKISDFVAELANGVRWLIQNFGQVVDWVKKIGVGLAVFFAFTAVLKTLVLVMTAVNLVMAANPVTLIILGIIALGAAIAAVIFWWDEIKAALISFAIVVVDKVVSAFKWLLDAFGSLPGPIQGAIALIAGPIGWLIGAASLVMKNWEPVSEFFADLWGGVVDIFEGALEIIMGIVATIMDLAATVSDTVSGITDGVGDAITGGIDAVSEGVGAVGSFLGFGDDEPPVMVSPAERTARSIEESRTTSTAEVTIRDQTGRAELTGGRIGAGLQLASTGDF